MDFPPWVSRTTGSSGASCGGGRSLVTSLFCVLVLLLPSLAEGASFDLYGVTVSPNTVNSYSKFTIDIDLPPAHSIQPPSGTIGLTFPSSVTVPASISANHISVNGTLVNTVSVSGQVVTITTPVTIKKGKVLQVIISANANIRLPSTAGVYDLPGETVDSFTDHFRCRCF